MDLYGERAFICPHCSIHAQQVWHQVLFKRENFVDDFGYNKLHEYYQVEEGSGVFFQDGDYLRQRNTLAFCMCQSCKKPSLWYDHELVYPFESIIDDPNPLMPLEVMEIYNEARSVLNLSPRSSAALLRLGLEILLPYLGAEKAKINTMIQQLVEERKAIGRVQKAMDALRVIGNDAVHPGVIDLEGRDDKEVSLALFKITNYIVAETLGSDDMIEDLYSLLPGKVKEGIENRKNPNNTK
ncbi:DUF4145 domain-containing protein [Exiguobacterium sp. RIT341]|uniref:DUF4145 domain-containing protein n=1 Tax=Exiguobacterium sp. RIT341 TaxID=1470592 RepID=UPI00044ECC4D|nr:DUF4145 domain-containing protein [Exiguobacterium sp. RIT341]EZP58381.1 hypothetical protein BW42_03063 [Exiguobacterium sp. RIT341]